jgi:hypothetical protein
MYILITILLVILKVKSVNINNHILRSITFCSSVVGLFIGVILVFTQVVSAQWTPIKGFQSDGEKGNFRYYTASRQNAIDMYKEVLFANDLNPSGLNFSKRHDPIISSFIVKENQPEMVYLIYIVKSSTGYILRLKSIENAQIMIQEEYTSINYENLKNKKEIKEFRLNPKRTIGIPYNLGNFKIAQYDFKDSLNGLETKKMLSKLGEGWRLPTIEEMKQINLNKEYLDDLTEDIYWVSNNYLNDSILAFSTFKNEVVKASLDSNFHIRPVSFIHGTIKSIIGTPYKVGNLEVAEFDFNTSMNWEDANFECKKLGNDWRLPTQMEMNEIVMERNLLGITPNSYWCSESNMDLKTAGIYNCAYMALYNSNMDWNQYVRPVRTYKRFRRE